MQVFHMALNRLANVYDQTPIARKLLSAITVLPLLPRQLVSASDRFSYVNGLQPYWPCPMCAGGHA